MVNIYQTTQTTADTTMGQIDIGQANLVSIQATFTGGSSATLGVEYSNDNVGWAAVTTPTTLSGTGTSMVIISDVQSRYLRVVTTASAGVGNMTVTVVTKGAQFNGKP
jgi:hypothetical protein